MSKKKAIHIVDEDGRVMCNGQDWMERIIFVGHYRHLVDTKRHPCLAEVCKRCAKQVNTPRLNRMLL